MILTCPSCRKSFRTDPTLFGAGPRTVACGFCRHQWQADGSALMTDQQFYDMRMRQMAAAGQLPQAQPAQTPAAPVPEPAAAPVPPPVPESDPAPEPVADAVAPDPESEDMDQAFAAALAEAAADSEMQPDEPAKPESNDLIIEADDVAPDDKEKSGKRRFGLFGGGGGRSADKKAAKAEKKKEKKPRQPKPPRRRAGVLTWVMWVLFILMVGGVCAAIYLLPGKIVSIWPPAEHLYKTLQIPVSKPGNGGDKSGEREGSSPAKATQNGRTSGDKPQDDSADEPKNKVGLDLTVPSFKRKRSANGRVSVTVQLHLKNISKRSRIVPQVVIKFLDANGESVLEKRVNWLTGPVSPGAEKHTDVEIDNVPESAMHLSAAFDVPGRGS